MESELKIHIFKNTISEFLQNNIQYAASYAKFPIKNSRIGKNEITNVMLTLTAQNNNIQNFVPELLLNQNEGIQAIWKNLTFLGVGESEKQEAKFYGKLKELKINFILTPPVNDNHKIDIFPAFYVQSVFCDYDDSTITFEFKGMKSYGAGLKTQIKSWVREAIDTQWYLPHDMFETAHHAIANYISSKVELDKFDGKFRLSKMQFYSDHIEFGYRLLVNEYPDSPMIHKFGPFKDTHEGSEKGIEVLFDENILNSILYLLYQNNFEFSMRDILSSNSAYLGKMVVSSF